MSGKYFGTDRAPGSKERDVAAADAVGRFVNRYIEAAPAQRIAATESGKAGTDDRNTLHVLAFARARILSRKNRRMILSTSDEPRHLPTRGGGWYGKDRLQPSDT